ncbi:MAG: hypothetical protein U0452_06025 [Anaerolineae bacterium]
MTTRPPFVTPSVQACNFITWRVSTGRHQQAKGRSRHVEIKGSTTVPDFPGFTCATLFEPGTLVLVSDTRQ